MTHLPDTVKPCPQCDAYMRLEAQKINHAGSCQIWGCPGCRRLEVYGVEMTTIKVKGETE